MPKVLFARFSLGLLCALAWAGCTVKQTEAPPVSGPSEFGLSFTITATPDSISQDGGSQSSIQLRAFDATGAPKSGVPFHLDMLVSGTPVDYGSLSTKNLVTGSDGRAQAVYTSPAALPAGANLPTCGGLPGLCMQVSATPVGNDYIGARSREVSIHLMPLGIILPPASTPTASFTFSPTSPAANSPAQFDASASCAGPTETNGSCTYGAPIAYAWEFGDGTTASGRLASHSFAAAQTYSVTLTVTNDRGVKASTSKQVTVGSGSAPTASFVYSPVPVVVGAEVYFDGSNSRPGIGHTIASYAWNWGDGESTSPAASPLQDHDFRVAGVYTVLLTVTDDAGQIGTTSQQVSVGQGPSASFTASVLNAATHTEHFDASASTPLGGSTIANYSWSFGDNTSSSGATTTVDHAYASAGHYTVLLTVTDSQGRIGVVSKVVDVP